MTTLKRAAGSLSQWLQHRHAPWYLGLLAVLLCAPSLLLGWQADDDFHRLALTRPDLPLLSRSPADLFVFIEGDQAVNRQAVVMGMLPWWSHEKLRIAFFRPLAGLTHWVDYKIWPSFPSLMHLHSLAWFGGAVVAAGFLYRRLFSSAWVAGLAALLFALDDAHGLPAAWLANRNALLGVFFGLLTLIAHDRWRRDGSRLGAMLAPVMLLLGLLSKESTVAIGAYLVAYALFLDRSSRIGRFISLLPCACTSIVWWAYYREHGYGAAGSGWYLDPGTGLLQLLSAFPNRASTLLAWQWLVPADLEWAMSPKTAHLLWLATMVFLVIIVLALVPLVRRDSLARFWALGMALSILPACTAYPDDRLLFFVGIGGMGLLAQFITAVSPMVKPRPRLTWRRLPVRALCAVLLFMHVGVAPVTLARASGSFKKLANSARQAADSPPPDPALPFQTTLIVNTPSFSTVAYGALARLLRGEPFLGPTLVLGSGGNPIEVHRPDKRTLLLRPEGGFLGHLGGRGPSGELEQLLFDQRCVMHSLDRMWRDTTPMTIGQRIELMGVTVEITAVTEHGRPTEAAFRFAFSLDNPFFQWQQWKDGAYAPFEPPAVGKTVTLPAATVRFRSVHAYVPESAGPRALPSSSVSSAWRR